MDISFTTQDFWIPLFQIIIVNIVLSGDNAVVIALAARSLPPHQQKKAIAWGSGAAIAMRIVLTLPGRRGCGNRLVQSPVGCDQNDPARRSGHEH